MALEKKLLPIAPVRFTSNGTTFGVVTISDTINFKDKQTVILQSNTVPQTNFQIKRVISSTQLIVGPNDNNLNPTNFSDISMFLVADNARISASLQDKTVLVPDKDHYLAIYESSPVNADRVIPVDGYGNIISVDNPLPVIFDGTISIGKVEVIGTNGNTIEPNANGSINVNVVSTPIAGNNVVNYYAEANAVPSGSTTTVIQYTVPFIKTSALLYRISVSGENIAKYTVFWNGVQIDTRRTFYGSSLSEYFEFTTGSNEGFVLSVGDQITVKVLHSRPFVADFEGRIQVLEIS